MRSRSLSRQAVRTPPWERACHQPTIASSNTIRRRSSRSCSPTSWRRPRRWNGSATSAPRSCGGRTSASSPDATRLPHGSRTVKSLGDGLMIVFASAVEAVAAAAAIQAAVATTLDDDPRADGRVRRPARGRADPRRGRLLRPSGRARAPALRRRRTRSDPRVGSRAQSGRRAECVRVPPARPPHVERPRRTGRRLRGCLGEACVRSFGCDTARSPQSRPRQLRATECGTGDPILRVEAGELRAVLLLGDGGLGKTRLAGELVRRRQNSAVCLSARAYPLGATASSAWRSGTQAHSARSSPPRSQSSAAPVPKISPHCCRVSPRPTRRCRSRHRRWCANSPRSRISWPVSRRRRPS